MGAAIMLGAGTVRPADVGWVLLVAAAVAAERTARAESGPDDEANASMADDGANAGMADDGAGRGHGG
jgi:hypothetical protein